VVLVFGVSTALAATLNQSQTIHIVRWGENLAMIATQYGTSVTAIVQANGLTNPNLIYPGQQLIIPLVSPPHPPPSQPTIYTVQPGDTLSAIAYRYGTTVWAIMHANNLSSSYIYAGQTLYIPASSPAPPYPSAFYYTVRWGDTLSAIAYRFGTTVEAIMQANHLYHPWLIYAGQSILIPTGGQISELPHPPATTYTVQPGDTLASIAYRFHTSVWAIVQANQLPNPSLIYPGQQLIIHGAGYPLPFYPIAVPLSYPAATPSPVPTSAFAPIVPTSVVPPPWHPTPYPTPPSLAGTPPAVTIVWEGRIISSDCGTADTREFRSILRVSVVGKKDLPVTVTALGWKGVTGRTGTKPEYGEYAVEFAPFKWGYYTVTPEGLGTSVQVLLDGRCTAYIEFRPQEATSTGP